MKRIFKITLEDPSLFNQKTIQPSKRAIQHAGRSQDGSFAII